MADRRVEMWEAVAAHAAARGARVSLADVCAVATESGRLSGAWVGAARNEEPDFVMYATDPVCERLGELQLTLGEGPCHEVLAWAAPVLASDLADGESGRRWPAFTPQAREAGAAAVFVFPLIVGAIRTGVLGLYRDSAGSPRDGQIGGLLVLADIATMMLLDSQTDGGTAAADGASLDGQSPDLAMHRAEIDQAAGMLTVQLGVTVTEAFARLRAYAYAEDRRLAEVASDIVTRRLRLHPDPIADAGL